MSLTELLNGLSRGLFDHRTYRRRAVDRWLVHHRTLLSGRVLDIGSKKGAGRGLFGLDRRSGDRWTALDLRVEASPDVVGRGEALPFGDGVFDAAVCSEVIEHVVDAESLLREIYRVLRPGGRLLLSSPFLYPIHGDPHDYHRFTETRLRQMLGRFRKVQIEPSGYFASVVGDVAVRALHGTSRRRFYKYVFYPLFPLIRLCVLLERHPLVRALYGWEGTVSGYLILAEK